MKETIKARWLNDLAFEAEVDGHKIYMDTSLEHGGKNTGPRPKPLMMIALAGCTGMDVAAILKKMRENIEELSVEVEGDVTEDHPKRFDGMKVIFRVRGKGVSRRNVEKAINLSKTKYCGVSANYTKAFPITYEIIIEE
ncbi:MAG: OsmC family protein [Bacteroidales bacterium]|nr:OsmC family protein [Bacteroidales bacterium]